MNRIERTLELEPRHAAVFLYGDPSHFLLLRSS